MNRQIGSDQNGFLVEDFNWSIVKTIHGSNINNVNDYIVRIEFRLIDNNGNRQKKLIELKKQDFVYFLKELNSSDANSD